MAVGNQGVPNKPPPNPKLNQTAPIITNSIDGSDKDYIPVGGSSTQSRKWKSPSRSRSLEQSSKIPRLVQGMCAVYAKGNNVASPQPATPVVGFYARTAQAATALANQVPTALEVPVTPVVPIVGTIPIAGVPQQPSAAPTSGTADCPVELDHSDIAQDNFGEGPVADQDQVSEPVQGAVPDSVMDFSHYEWLFTVSKAK